MASPTVLKAVSTCHWPKEGLLLRRSYFVCMPPDFAVLPHHVALVEAGLGLAVMGPNWLPGAPLSTSPMADGLHRRAGEGTQQVTSRIRVPC
jgi:hypothetical protein